MGQKNWGWTFGFGLGLSLRFGWGKIVVESVVRVRDEVGIRGGICAGNGRFGQGLSMG